MAWGLMCVEERQRLSDAVKHHQRDRNRAPSEPAGECLSSGAVYDADENRVA